MALRHSHPYSPAHLYAAVRDNGSVRLYGNANLHIWEGETLASPASSGQRRLYCDVHPYSISADCTLLGF